MLQTIKANLQAIVKVGTVGWIVNVNVKFKQARDVLIPVLAALQIKTLFVVFNRFSFRQTAVSV